MGVKWWGRTDVAERRIRFFTFLASLPVGPQMNHRDVMVMAVSVKAKARDKRDHRSVPKVRGRSARLEG